MHKSLLLLALVGCTKDGPAETSPSTITLPSDFTVVITPDGATTLDTLSVEIVPGSDPIDDGIEWTYAWSVDGSVRGDLTEPTVSADETNKGQEWSVSAAPVLEGITGGARSGTLVINNALPTATVSLPAEAPEGTVITATAVGLDADADPVTFAYRWIVNGVDVPDATTELLDPSLAVLGDVVEVEVVPNDGEDDGLPARSAPVTISEREPVTPKYDGFGFHTLVDFGPRYKPSDINELPDGNLMILGLSCEVTLFDPFADEIIASDDVGDWPQDCVAMARHPSFGDGVHDTVYIWRNMATELWRYTVQLEPSFALQDGELMLRALDKGYSDGHSGGDLLWWDGETPEPVLYLTIGDGNPDSGQDDSTLFGSMIAYAEDPVTGDLVPGVPDSPYTNPANVAKGVRNPWRLADCGPTICMADVARDDFEEFDVYTGTPANYGWSVVEGAVGDPAFIDPEWMYHHDDTWLVEEDTDNAGLPDEMNVIWVGEVLDEKPFGGALDGGLLVGDHYDGWIRLFELTPDGFPTGKSEHLAHLRYVTSMIEADDGRIYASDLSGTLRRMVARDEIPAADVAGAPLSLSPYYDTGMPTWPFEVRHALWSNGSGKDRLLQLPVGAKIDNSDPDNWVFPIGTHLWKTFFVDDVAVETRVLRRDEEGWVTGTYEYAEDGDAYFTDGYNVHLDTPSGPYMIPSIASCEECHAGTREKDFPLGLSAFQLGDDGLAAIQDALLEPQTVAPQVIGDPLTQEVRGYLHGNCSYCHNENGRVADLVSLLIDFTYSTPLADMRIVGVEAKFLPQPAAPLIIDPGRPENSALVKLLEANMMPPIGLWSPDTTAVADIEAWINTL